jgi:hypothetical protein
MLKSLKVEFELKLIEIMPIKEKYKLYEKLKLAKKINKQATKLKKNKKFKNNLSGDDV